MGIREENKLMTKKRIIENTKKLLYENGFVKVSTKDISRVSNVAQGSIFLHFETKDKLLHRIISSDLELLQSEIKDNVDSKNDTQTFLKDFLDVIIEHENMLSRVYKDIAYLNDDIHKVIENIEVRLKNLIFDNIRSNLAVSLSIVDSFINIDAFMALVRVYLQDKDSSSEFSSVIKQRRGKLTKLYRTLFGE